MIFSLQYNTDVFLHLADLYSHSTKSNDIDKRSNIQRVGVTQPLYGFVADPLQAGETLSLISGVKMVTAPMLAVGRPGKSC